MSLPKFIFFIVEEDGRTRQVVNGVVTSLNTPRMLPNAPDGNQEISIGWERSAIYYGNVRNFSLKLGFVRDGRLILANDFYKFNADRLLYLLIKRYTCEVGATTFKEYYKQFYKGQFDLVTSEDNQGEYRFEANLMEGGLQRLFKAAENTKYFIPFDDDAKNVRMDGMIIGGAFKWLIVEYLAGSSGALPTMVKQGEEHAVPGIYVSDISGGYPLTFSAINQDSTEYFLACTSTPTGGTAHVTGRFVLSNPLPAFPMNLVIWVYNTIAGTLTQQPLFVGPEAEIIDVDITLPLVKGDRWFLEIDEYHYDSTLNVDVKGRFETTYVKAFTLYDAWRKMVAKITGNADDFQSIILPNVNILLTSGDGVRGLPGAGITTSPKDLWEATNVYIMAGLQIGTKIRVEGRAAFFVPEAVTPAIDLGEVKNFKCTNTEEFFGTTIKVGHADPQTDDTNGKYDFAGHQIFSTPMKGIAAKEINLQSNYKASPWEIENKRANYEGQTTTDSQADNDIFAIAALPEPNSSIFEMVMTFFADGAPFEPGAPMMRTLDQTPRIKEGMKLRITGSTSNNADFTVLRTSRSFLGQFIVTNEPIISETGVGITIEVIGGQYYVLDRNTPITQLTSPDVEQVIKDTVFNVPLSPARILQAHFPWLAGVFAGYAPGVLKFESENRNREMIAGGITEKADIPIASLGPAMFKPKWFEFDNTVPANLPEIHETNATPVFGFIWKGVRYTGFQWKDAFAASTQEEQTFKLLACPENDLLTLI